MYIMCVCLFTAMRRRVGALQISIIIIIKSMVLVGGGVGDKSRWLGEGSGGEGVNHTTRLSGNDGSDHLCDAERWLKEYPLGGDRQVSQIALLGSRRGTHCDKSESFCGRRGTNDRTGHCGLLGNGTSHCLWFIGERLRVTACVLLGNGYESLPVFYWGAGTSHCL